MSWDEAFADRYDEWTDGMTDDIAFYVELARAADGPLVELAVGSGRVAIPVALATKRAVIGIDTSPAMSPRPVSGLRQPGSNWICTTATCASSRSTSQRR